MVLQGCLDPGVSSFPLSSTSVFRLGEGPQAQECFDSYKLRSWALNLTACLLFSSVQSCPTFVTPWSAACQASLSFTNSWSLLKLMSIKSVMPSNHLILCHPFILLPSIFPTIRVFSNESVLCIRWPKYWSFSFSISPSNEYSGLISFRRDWFDLLAVQGTLRMLISLGRVKQISSIVQPICTVVLLRNTFTLRYEFCKTNQTASL